jgi:hypothetical protein
VTTAPTKVDPAIFEIAITRLCQVIEEAIIAFENVLGSPILWRVIRLCLGNGRRHCCMIGSSRGRRGEAYADI